jgi:hypothetical protein
MRFGQLNRVHRGKNSTCKPPATFIPINTLIILRQRVTFRRSRSVTTQMHRRELPLRLLLPLRFLLRDLRAGRILPMVQLLRLRLVQTRLVRLVQPKLVQPKLVKPKLVQLKLVRLRVVRRQGILLRETPLGLHNGLLDRVRSLLLRETLLGIQERGFLHTLKTPFGARRGLERLIEEL